MFSRAARALALLPAACAASGCSLSGGYAALSCKLEAGATVDDYLYAASSFASPMGFANDSSGIVYAVGEIDDGASIHWLVRKSADRGATWATADDYQLASAKNSVAQHAGTDASGNVYVIGWATDASNLTHSILRKSADHGSSWTTVDDYNDVSGQNASGLDVLIDPSGALYAMSSGVDGSGVAHLLVRKSTDGGSSFGTPSDLTFGTGNSTFVDGQVLRDRAGVLYFSLSARGTSLGAYQWFVARSADSGATLSQVDNYWPGGTGNASEAWQAAQDQKGKLYVTGFAHDSGGVIHAIVRSSTDGTTWTTLADLPATASYNVKTAPALIADDLGDLRWLVTYADASSNLHYQVLSSADQGSTWATLEDLSATTAGTPLGGALGASSVTGDLYLLYAPASGTADDWDARRYLCR